MDDLVDVDGNRRIAELVYRLVTEGQNPARQAVAVGTGVFIGCIPLFGTHLALVLLVATILKLSRMRMYAATWISNPLFAPFLVWSEFQVGSFLLTGKFVDHSLEGVRNSGAWALGQALAVGAVAVGLALGFAAALLVWRWIPRGDDEIRNRSVIEESAHRYLNLGLGPWIRTRRMLYGNRALVGMVTSGKLEPKNVLTDLGCGRGEFLALLVCGSPRGIPASCTGITSDSSSAAIAKRVLPPSVHIEVGDPEVACFDAADTVVVWNSSTRDSPEVSQRLVRTVRSSINPSGAFLIAWSNHRGSVDAKTVVQWLEAEGFVVREHSVSTSWYRRQDVILATT